MELNVIATSIEKVKITKNTTAVVYVDCILNAQEIARAETHFAAKLGCKVVVMDKRQQAYFIQSKPSPASKKSKPAPTCSSFGEFGNVNLSEEEHGKLVERFGLADTRRAIEELSAYMESKRKRYANHYATLLNWVKRFAPTSMRAGEIPSISRSYTNEEINAMFDKIRPEDI